MKKTRFNIFLVVILIASLFSSCAAAGNMISHQVWVGLLDLAAVAAISVYIFLGKK